MQNECYQNKHLLICVVVAIPMLVLYAIVIPLVIMVVLWKAGKDRVTDPSLLIRWGLGKYIKRRSANGCSFDFYYFSFKLVSSSSKTPKQVFFNVINIWNTIYTHCLLYYKYTVYSFYRQNNCFESVFWISC